MPGDRGYRFVVAAATTALLAVLVLAFVPLGVSTTVEALPPDAPPGTTAAVDVERQTLVESDGGDVVLGVLVPLALVVTFPLLVPSGTTARSVRGVSAGVLLLGSFLTILSVGILLLPTAILMLIAMLTTERVDRQGPPVGA